MNLKTEYTKVLPLRLNLQHFAEETGEGNNADSSDATENTNNGVNHTNSPSTEQKQQSDHMIPKNRFDEVNSKFKETQAQLQELLNEKKEAEKKAQEEQGKFQELYQNTQQEFESFKSRYEQTDTRAKELEGVITNLLESRLSNIDEQFHDLIPENLTPEQKLNWIERAESKGIFGKQAQKSEEPVGEGTNPSNAQATDLNSLNPMQLLMAGYGKKK